MKNLLALVLFCPIAAYAGTPKPKEVTLAVVAAPDDAILPVAYLVFPAEGRDQHVVNAINGKWSGSTLYPENGAEIPFTKGYTTEVYASGPGYQLTRASIVVGSHGLSQKISLTPIDYGDYRGAASPTASEILARPETATVAELADVGRYFAANGTPHAEVLAWTDRALLAAKRGATGDDFVAKTDRLMGIRALSALEVPRAAEDVVVVENLGNAQDLAKSWLDYSVAAHLDTRLAKQVCDSAWGHDAMCTIP